MRDVLWLDVAGGFVELFIKRGRLDLAAPGQGAERSVLAELTKHVQAAVDQFLERDAVVVGDVVEADVNFLLVVFGADIDRWPHFRQRPEPILADNVRDILHHLDDALAGAALAGKQPGLFQRDAIRDCPLTLGSRLIVPIGHIEPLAAVAVWMGLHLQEAATPTP